MSVQITIPSPGESVTEVTLGPWHKGDGEWVEKDEIIVEIESDKVTMEVPAPESGLLKVIANEGEEKSVGDAIGSIDPSAAKPASTSGEKDAKARSAVESKESPAPGTLSAAAATKDKAPAQSKTATATKPNGESTGGARVTPVARKIAEERGVDLATLQGTGPSGRIRKSDVLSAGSASPAPSAAPTSGGGGGERGARREKNTKLRQRIAERLVQAQQTAAMLTTFNEADMSAVMALRKQYKEQFAEKHGVGLGFMSFFVKACVSALQKYPNVNAYFMGSEIEYHDFCDVSVAVGTPRGLVVPVLRNAEQLSFAEIEGGIRELAIRARDGKLTIDEMTGGTFTISNGGVYGSLNSTPILNPPQSGILGMHKIMNRPVENPDKPGEIVLRPMMYLALSYDHRIVDGEGAVGFLVHIKECIEHPERMLLGM